MIHERSGSASTYHGVDVDYTTMPDGSRRAQLGNEPLEKTIARVVPGAEPGVGWYWSQESPSERPVWFLRREHAEAFLAHLRAG